MLLFLRKQGHVMLLLNCKAFYDELNTMICKFWWSQQDDNYKLHSDHRCNAWSKQVAMVGS
jgi:hypothetical protein